MHCTILSGHRKVAPLGLKGGAVSENSRSLVHRIDGRIEELAARAKTTLEVGEAITIVTPTGGGFGDPRKANDDRDRVAAGVGRDCCKVGLDHQSHRVR
jgi:N-methylhydantoinase B/oxoprolinase/acetone carboxylase alpha subunit